MAETPRRGITTVTGPLARLSLMAVIASDLRTLFRCRPHQSDTGVVKVEVAAQKRAGYRFPRPEIHLVDRARPDHWGNALAARRFEPVRSRAHDTAHHLVCEFRGRHVENGSECTVFDQLFHRLSANSRSVKD